MCLIQKENYKKSHKNQFFRPGNGVLVWQVIPGYDSPTGGRMSFLYLARGLVPHLRTLPPIMQWAPDFWRKVAVKATLSAVVTSITSAPRGALDLLRISMVTEATPCYREYHCNILNGIRDGTCMRLVCFFIPRSCKGGFGHGLSVLILKCIEHIGKLVFFPL